MGGKGVNLYIILSLRRFSQIKIKQSYNEENSYFSKLSSNVYFL